LRNFRELKHSPLLHAQDIDSETAGLPGHYAAPGGVILLAADGGADAGCVALRPALGERVKNGVCVMKRLYVRPGHQGRSIGRLLVQAAIGAARELGYSGIVLDTLGRLESANKLYDGMGFQICQEPFYDSPLPGTVCWHMQL
jgi:GNAT superfamily N-acetyltransferase